MITLKASDLKPNYLPDTEIEKSIRNAHELDRDSVSLPLRRISNEQQMQLSHNGFHLRVDLKTMTLIVDVP